MNPNLLAIIVAFYLSKYDKQGLKNLGFKNDADAFQTTANILGIKKNYIKFRRDEFDPIHPWRRGWQRPMDNRIIRSIEALQDLEEQDLREIVLKILNDKDYKKSEEAEKITSLFAEKKKEKKSKYVLRGPTGRQAEDFFISYFPNNYMPVEGKLIDCRDFGIGYDFQIVTGKEDYFIEVKGLSDISGGVLLTNKEWITAKEKGDYYYLCIVSNIGDAPKLKLIQNPAIKLNPKKNVCATIQINWSVTNKQLSELTK
jgi:hypothetical protein